MDFQYLDAPYPDKYALAVGSIQRPMIKLMIS